MSEHFTDTYFKDKLVMWLNEAWEEYRSGGESEFLLGKIYAYVECLETILREENADNDALLAIERKYGIRP